MKGLYKVLYIFYLFATLAFSKCPNNCNGNGYCDKYSRCHCSTGFQGGDCSERICPFDSSWSDQATANDTAHAFSECSNRGICDRKLGKCLCMKGFSGAACERMTCENDCSENGVCLTMEELAHKTRNDLSQSFLYSNIWDAKKIKGCKCDNGKEGYDCSLSGCPKGDDPLTKGQVNEIQLLKCTAQSGTFVLYYKGVASRTIPYNANAEYLKNALLSIPELTGIKISFSQLHGSVCQYKANVVQIEFTQQFGPINPLVPLLDKTMTNAGGSIQIASNGEIMVDVTGKIFTSVTGTKESLLCAGRGTCDLKDGICNCYDTNGDSYGSSNGYGSAGTRGDCGYVVSSTSGNVSTCPGEIFCSGHGVCDHSTYQCFCSSGWSGGDCSEMTCPMGKSWFSYPTADNQAHDNYIECSNMGICDKSVGKCKCRSGFYGEACEYMACNGVSEQNYGTLTTKQFPSVCSGHGRCMSMAELAEWSVNNGDATDITYGSFPNNPNTWDAYRIHGCLCDDGYTGYDCSLKECPRGDDPGTYDDHSEVQLLQCIADGGNFTLSFRQSVTSPLSFNLTAYEFQLALTSLSTIRNIEVYFSLDGPPPNGTLNYEIPKRARIPGIPAWGGFIGPNKTFVQYTYPSSNATYPKNSTFCRTDGSQVAIILFSYTHGNLPAIIPNNEHLHDLINGNGGPYSGKVNVYHDGQSVNGLTSISGTTENDLCNNRGLCDTSTGICHCFETWASSDGKRQGGQGIVGDCGYRYIDPYNFINAPK